MLSGNLIKNLNNVKCYFLMVLSFFLACCGAVVRAFPCDFFSLSFVLFLSQRHCK